MTEAECLQSITISRFPIQCGLRHEILNCDFFLLKNVYQSLSNSVRITTKREGRVEIPFVSYQSLSNSVRITTPGIFPRQFFSYFSISRFPIQCGLRLSIQQIRYNFLPKLSVAFQFSADYDTVIYLVFLYYYYSISRFPIQCGLRHRIHNRIENHTTLSVAFQFSADYDIKT